MDEFLTCYQRNISLRDCNIEAKLCIGREGEYGEYPSEPYLDYMKLDVEGFEENSRTRIFIPISHLETWHIWLCIQI